MHQAFDLLNRIGSQGRPRGADALIAELATMQHGVVATWQLLRLGLSHREIHLRRRSGLLHPLHRGVSAVGHMAISREARMMAAALSCGPHGVLSHFSAATIWQLLDPRDRWPDVTVPSARRRRRGIILHASRLPDDEIRRVDQLPVTSVPRTLLDLATVLRPDRLERAVNEAEVRKRTDLLSLPDLLGRYPAGTGHAPSEPSSPPRASARTSRTGSSRCASAPS